MPAPHGGEGCCALCQARGPAPTPKAGARRADMATVIEHALPAVHHLLASAEFGVPQLCTEHRAACLPRSQQVQQCRGTLVGGSRHGRGGRREELRGRPATGPAADRPKRSEGVVPCPVRFSRHRKSDPGHFCSNGSSVKSFHLFLFHPFILLPFESVCLTSHTPSHFCILFVYRLLRLFYQLSHIVRTAGQWRELGTNLADLIFCCRVKMSSHNMQQAVDQLTKMVEVCASRCPVPPWFFCAALCPSFLRACASSVGRAAVVPSQRTGDA
jgi:hypothetical protein